MYLVSTRYTKPDRKGFPVFWDGRVAYLKLMLANVRWPRWQSNSEIWSTRKETYTHMIRAIAELKRQILSSALTLTSRPIYRKLYFLVFAPTLIDCRRVVANQLTSSESRSKAIRAFICDESSLDLLFAASRMLPDNLMSQQLKKRWIIHRASKLLSC